MVMYMRRASATRWLAMGRWLERYPILQLLAEHRVRVTSGMRDGCSIVISVTVWRIRIIIEFRGL